MAGNIQNVSFMAPGVAMIAPDIAAQEQALQRRQAYVDMLRQQGAQDINPNGGAISWTQGMAKMLSAYAAGRGQRKVDQDQLRLAQALRGAMGPMFGGRASTPGFGQNPDGTDLNAPATSPAPSPSLDLPATGQTIQLPATQPETSPAAPQAGGGNLAPAAPSQGPLQMPGLSPQESQARYMLDPQGYMQQLQASSSPTDAMKNLAAQFGWGTPAFKQAMADLNFKNAYVAPINGRPGGIHRDPKDPTRILAYDPTTPVNGASPTFDAAGNVTSWHLPPGATQAVAAIEGAKTAGQNANEPITGYDAQGNPVFGSKLDAAHGGAGVPGGFRPSPGLGAGAFADKMGGEGGKFFADLQNGAADTNNRVYALRQMGALIADPKANFGPGAATWNQVFGTLKTTFGVPDPALTNAQEFNKWAAQYSARSAADLGLSGSDARVQMAVHATPNGTMTRQALAQIIPQMVGLETAKGAMALAAARFAAQNPGPNAQGAFLSQWRQAYDPRIFSAMALGSKGVQHLLATLPPAERQALIHKSQALAQMGAFQQ